MEKVKKLYEKAHDMLYDYNKSKLLDWLKTKENLILLENYTSILKENMRGTFIKDKQSIRMSKLYFKSEFPNLKHTRNREKK